MSRIGREPITVPAGVEVTIAEGNVVTVKGPKGTITEALCPEMTITLTDGVLHVARKEVCSLHTPEPVRRGDKLYKLVDA